RRVDDDAPAARKKEARQILGPAALRAEARHEKEAVAENGADRLALLRSRRSDDRADRAQPARADRVAPPFADARGDSRVERLTSAVEVLELGGGGIRRPHEDEEPLAAVADSLEPGLHAVAPRVRVERHGIRARPERVRRVAKESLGIG